MPVNTSRREDIRLSDVRHQTGCIPGREKVLKMDGAFAPKGLKFDTAYGCEGCGGALRAQYKCCLRQRAPFGGWRHHLSRWEACHWILSRLSAPYESSSLATPYSGGTMGAGQWPQCEFMTVTEKNHTTGLRPEENRPTALRALEMHPFCLRHLPRRGRF